VRIQRAVGPESDTDLVLEAFAGLYAIFPAAGVGARLQFLPLSGQHNSLVISPGIDAYVTSLILTWGTAVGANVDIAWRHVYASGCDGRVGVELGGADLIRADRYNVLVPVVALFGGWRF